MGKLSFSTLVSAAFAAATFAFAPASAEHSYTRTSGSPAVTCRLDETKSSNGGLCDANVTQHSGYFKIDEQGKTNQHVSLPADQEKPISLKVSHELVLRTKVLLLDVRVSFQTCL